jgi:L-lactate dehydrogenase complex protein LldG
MKSGPENAGGRSVIARVCRALGRASVPSTVPPPPEIPDTVARLVHSNIGLAELFETRAVKQHMIAEPVSAEELPDKLAEFLRERKCRRVMISDTPLLRKMEVGDQLDERGFEARYWSGITADGAYEYDAGLTEVDYAVAETGTLVIRHRPEHGRLLSLVPFVHVAVVQPKNFVPDLIDLFEILAKEGTGSGVTMISGPSKTADIEMNVVTGVHGPNVVRVYVLQ